MALLGIDVGTTACKAAVFDEKGKLLSQARTEVQKIQPQKGYAEIEPSEMWLAVKCCIHSACIGIRDQVDALAVSSHGEGVIGLDDANRPVGGEILSYDTRSVKETKLLEQRFGKRYFFERGGQLLGSTGTAAKINWMTNHSSYYRSLPKRFVCAGDYITMCLTGVRAIDYSLAARTLLLDIHAKKWNTELLDVLGIEKEQMSRLIQAGEPVGEVLKSVSDELFSGRRVLVVSGGHDQPCAMLGTGATRAGEAAYSLGTTETLVCAFPEFKQELYDQGLACYPDVVKGRYVTLPGNFTGGNLLEWFRDEFAGKESYEALMEAMEQVPSSLLVLPHFTITGSPWNDSYSKGIIAGLGLDTTKGQYIRGLQEGVTYEILLNLLVLNALDAGIKKLIAIGGGTNSAKLMQLKADVLGTEIVVPLVSEAPCKGTALLAGQGSGALTDICECWRDREYIASFLPDARNHRYYREQFARYEKLYPFVKEIYGN